MDRIFDKYKKQVDEIIEVCARDGQLGYGPSVSGNVSYRVDDDFVIVTPTNVPKRLMRPEYLCAVRLNGEIIYTPEGKKPTGELFMHLHCLRKRPDIKAVMHAHPPISTFNFKGGKRGAYASAYPGGDDAARSRCYGALR